MKLADTGMKRQMMKLSQKEQHRLIAAIMVRPNNRLLSQFKFLLLY